MGWVVNYTLRPLYPRERNPVLIIQEAGWAPGPVWTGVKIIFPPPGFDHRAIESIPTELSRSALYLHLGSVYGYGSVRLLRFLPLVGGAKDVGFRDFVRNVFCIKCRIAVTTLSVQEYVYAFQVHFELGQGMPYTDPASASSSLDNPGSLSLYHVLFSVNRSPQLSTSPY